MGSALCDRCANITWFGVATVYTGHGEEYWCGTCCDNYAVVCDKCGDTYEEEWGNINSDGVCLCCRIDRAEPDYDYKHEERKNRDN